MSAQRVLVPLASGFEEIEAVTVIDVLRRAGAEVVAAGLVPGLVRGAHGLSLATDAVLSDLDPGTFDLIVLPGGMPGATHLRDDAGVRRFLTAIHGQGGTVAAICAAPIALGPAGLAAGRTITSYPGFGDQVECGAWVEDRVVVDDRVITSRGPGTALEFALTLVERLFGSEAAESLQSGMLVHRPEPARRI